MASRLLINCVRADASRQLGMTADGKPAPVVTPEQVEAARLRAEVARAASAQPAVERRHHYLSTDEGWLYLAAVMTRTAAKW